MKKYRITFDSLDAALSGFCSKMSACANCPLGGKTTDESCADYCNAHPEEAVAIIGAEIIEVEDKPRLTEQELAICKAVGAKWASIDDDGGDVELWDEEPCKGSNGSYFIGYPPSPFGLARIASGLFPSLRPGDCVNVEEQMNDE